MVFVYYDQETVIRGEEDEGDGGIKLIGVGQAKVDPR